MSADLSSDLSPDLERLSRAVAPVILFDANEPFLPSAVGVSLIDKPGRAVAAPQQITFEAGVAKVIEFAIWWDWDIQHLYELEHVWVKLDATDAVIGVTASAHGSQTDMRRADGTLAMEAGRVTLFSEPGKHAFHAMPPEMQEDRRHLAAACSGLSLHGFFMGHILVNETGREMLPDFAPEDHRRARRHLQRQAFTPRFEYSRRFDLRQVPFLSWQGLKSYFGQRVPDIVANLRESQPLIRTVFLDSGDTLVDEGSEVWEDGIVQTANLIPGTAEMMAALVEEGYRLCLVADGRVQSFRNVLGAHGLFELFEARIISEDLGCEKPHRRMFEAALAAMGLDAADAADCVMVGNNLGRDIAGAKAAGLTTIWLDWSPRRSKQPKTADEVPDFVISKPTQLPKLLEHIELDMWHRRQRARLAPGEID